MMDKVEEEKIIMKLIFTAVELCYGYNFNEYSEASMLRRLRNVMDIHKIDNWYEVIQIIVQRPEFFHDFLNTLVVSTTSMFRTPGLYKTMRKKVVPYLRTFPYLRVWSAGCSTGEEPYSMAIFLYEEGLLEKAHIYATDIQENSLNIAKEGIYGGELFDKAIDDYKIAGGKGDLRDYFLKHGDLFRVHDMFKERITFSSHNLTTDGSFGEMNVIICRNVFIYFNKNLQEKTLSLFTESLYHLGFLCLGDKETIDFSGVKKAYECISPEYKIYKKNLGNNGK